MTATQENNIRTEYATEDINLAIESGSMMITDTKEGLLSINHEDGHFQIFLNNGTLRAEFFNTARAIKFVASMYVFEVA